MRRVLSPSSAARQAQRAAAAAMPRPPRADAPRAARAKDVVTELERRRGSSGSGGGLQPVVAAALLERTPVVMRARKDWEHAMDAVWARVAGERADAAREAVGGKVTTVEAVYAKTVAAQVQGAGGGNLAWVAEVAGLGRKMDVTAEETAAKSAAEEGDKPPAPAAAATTSTAATTTTTTTTNAAGDMSNLLGLGIELEEAVVATAPVTPTYQSKRKTNTVANEPEMRSSAADGDVTSLDRAMEESVYLVVKVKGKWQLPSAVYMDKAGETMVSTAQRGLFQTLKPSSQVHFVSQAPVGRSLQQGFLYRALVVRPASVEFAPEVKEYAWMTRRELAQALGGSDPNERAFFLMLTDVGDDEATPADPVLSELFEAASKVREEKKRALTLSMSAGAPSSPSAPAPTPAPVHASRARREGDGGEGEGEERAAVRR